MKNTQLTLVAAQLNPLVGDIEGNAQLIIDEVRSIYETTKADLIAFPELSLTGYPPEDLLLREHLYTRCEAALAKIMQETSQLDTAFIIGYPKKEQEYRYNAAACICAGRIIGERLKECLPNYTVFDEKRYFNAGGEPCVFTLKGVHIGLIICEDTWFEKPASDAKAHGAEIIVSINASPYDRLKKRARELMLISRVNEVKIPIVYINCVGGQDELVFDGGSFAMNPDGKIAAQAKFFETQNLTITVSKNGHCEIERQPLPEREPIEAQIYSALVLGVRDYIQKNKFPGAIVGLSGGIDSALMFAIAADAIGADKLLGVLMPSRFTADISIEDAIAEVEALGAKHETISIEPMYDTFLAQMKPVFKDQVHDTTEENMQARIRCIILMALSNRYGHIVLTTGNKSEMSVGYATLYGDMAGGFAALKDIPKTMVYKLARYRNRISQVIPERVIRREPSAELAHNQKDQDSLPDYDTLDAIIDLYVDQDQPPHAIIDKGFDADVVHRIVKLIARNEYKRRQAPPGIRTSNRAYGKDRRYPITSGYE